MLRTIANLLLDFSLLGMWSTSFYLGDFIGMTGGGILVTYLGYSKMSAFYVVAYVVFCFVDLFELSSTIQEDKERQLKREEREEQEKDKGSSKSNKPAVSEKLPEILKPGSLNPDEIAFGSHSETREAANVVSMYAIDADTDSVKSSSSEDSESVRSDATLPSGKRLASQELAANDSKNDAKEGT